MNFSLKVKASLPWIKDDHGLNARICSILLKILKYLQIVQKFIEKVSI